MISRILSVVEEILREVKKGHTETMAAIDDLNAEIIAVTTSVSNEISASTAAITAALANNDSAAIEAAVTNLKNVQTTLDNYTASLAPTPVPPVPPATT